MRYALVGCAGQGRPRIKNKKNSRSSPPFPPPTPAVRLVIQCQGQAKLLATARCGWRGLGFNRQNGREGELGGEGESHFFASQEHAKRHLREKMEVGPNRFYFRQK